jgi:hypothetical protein
VHAVGRKAIKFDLPSMGFEAMLMKFRRWKSIIYVDKDCAQWQKIDRQGVGPPCKENKTWLMWV